MSVLACGPYIGNFEQEILTFRPYVKWLTEAVSYSKVYVNTHSNRFFLYDFIPEENLIPVYENLSRDESNQVGYIHNKVKQDDFNVIVKKFKDDIIKKEKCNKRNIDLYHLNYVKSTPPYSIYKKIFERINVDTNNNGKIIFIPSNIEDKIKLRYIYVNLDDIEIIGDENTYFRKDNKVLSRIDYFENGWKTNIEKITSAKAVICPISFWTTISNLQSIPVFSWGENVSQHREEGIYHFDNKKCFTFPTSPGTDSKIILKMLEYFLEEL